MKKMGQKIGYKHSEETKRKISLMLMGNKSKTGQHNSEETRKKLSIALKGKNSGKHASAETRLKLSLIHKGKPNGKLGTHPTEETLKKLRFTRIGKKPFLGKHHSEETKKKIGVASLGRKPLLGYHHSEATKTKISLSHKRNPKILNNLANLRSRIRKPSKPQMELYFFLKQIFPDAVLEYPIKTAETYRFADIGVPSLKIAFEYDSAYWHANRRADDRKRDLELAAIGWMTFRVNKQSLAVLSKQPIFTLSMEIKA